MEKGAGEGAELELTPKNPPDADVAVVVVEAAAVNPKVTVEGTASQPETLETEEPLCREM